MTARGWLAVGAAELGLAFCAVGLFSVLSAHADGGAYEFGFLSAFWFGAALPLASVASVTMIASPLRSRRTQALLLVGAGLLAVGAAAAAVEPPMLRAFVEASTCFGTPTPHLPARPFGYIELAAVAGLAGTLSLVAAAILHRRISTSAPMPYDGRLLWVPLLAALVLGSASFLLVLGPPVAAPPGGPAYFVC